MAMSERLITMIAQWAKGAQINIPTPPVPGIAYRNVNLIADDIESGQSYDKVYDSARYNQMDYIVTGLLQLIEQCGIMPWSSLTNYQASGICMGLDGILYQAVLASGPSNGGYKPTSNATYWKKALDAASIDLSGFVPVARSISTSSPLSGGGDLSANRTISIGRAGAASATTAGSPGYVILAPGNAPSSVWDQAETPAGAALKIAAALGGGGGSGNGGGTAPPPSSGSGIGQWTTFSYSFNPAFANNGPMKLPSGGTWAYFIPFITNSYIVGGGDGAYNATEAVGPLAGVAAGGSSVVTSGGERHIDVYGLCWRVA